jgi:hypothetical protein
MPYDYIVNLTRDGFSSFSAQYNNYFGNLKRIKHITKTGRLGNW